jgi:oxygen-independent coproporphyrinogen-3 oxidase
VHLHSFPKPVWAQRGYEHDGRQAWQNIPAHVHKKRKNDPISIYVHVPFCERKCGFCDLYSLPMPESKRHMENEFAAALQDEIDAWSSIEPLNVCPVTTIHFGGGTPNFLSLQVLGGIVGKCRERFGVTSRTELAIESTSRLLAGEHLDRLRELGFTRLHVGVQCLEDQTRKLIGRKETAELVLQRLADAIRKGFVVSVDVIYGLPGQTLMHMMATLEQLVSAGVHGFSLYQLQTCPRNRAFLKRRGGDKPDPVLNYVLFQSAEHFLRKKGYRKNFFTHFAFPPDKCLYYRHVRREEDLLALGPTADGVFGNYVYRHGEYREYIGSPPPALEGGMVESPVEKKTRPAIAALMTASIPGSMMRELSAEPLLDLWQACGMITRTHDAGEFELTANGSWFMTTLIAQLRERVRAQTKP